MDQVVTALWGVLAAGVSALGWVLIGLLRQAAEAQAQRALLLVQQRLGEGAARIAGEIAGQVLADPALQGATRAMLDAGAAEMQRRFADSVARRGISVDALRGMVAGEVGKLGVGLPR